MSQNRMPHLNGSNRCNAVACASVLMFLVTLTCSPYNNVFKQRIFFPQIAGTEVSINYGPWSNDLFFLLFGFVPQDNPQESVVLFDDFHVLLDMYLEFLRDASSQAETSDQSIGPSQPLNQVSSKQMQSDAMPMSDATASTCGNIHHNIADVDYEALEEEIVRFAEHTSATDDSVGASYDVQQWFDLFVSAEGIDARIYAAIRCIDQALGVLYPNIAPRQLLGQDHNASAQHKHASTDSAAGGQSVGVSQDAANLCKLRCTVILSQFTSTMESDQRELDAGLLTPAQNLVVTYRLGKKVVLNNALRSL